MKISSPVKAFRELQEKKLLKKESIVLFRERVAFLFDPKNKHEQKRLTEALKNNGITAPILAATFESFVQNVGVSVRRELRVMKGYHGNTLNLIKGTTIFSKIVVVVRDLCDFTDVSDIASEDAIQVIVDFGIFCSSQ